MTIRGSTPHEASTRRQHVAMGDKQTVRVLVVDDQTPFRNAARSVVDRMAGFEIVGEAESGEDAVDMAATIAPDLVLMDINLGGMNGIDATRRIVGSNPAVMVVLLSTYELDDLPSDARSSGAVAYIAKDDFGGRRIRSLWELGGDPDFRR